MLQSEKQIANRTYRGLAANQSIRPISQSVNPWISESRRTRRTAVVAFCWKVCRVTLTALVSVSAGSACRTLSKKFSAISLTCDGGSTSL